MPDTANHAVRDGDLRIVYIAGAKGLYKLFPDSGEIAMMYPVAVGEQAYMVGYAALTRRVVPIPVEVELILAPNKPQGYGYGDPQYVFRHYTLAGGWVNIVPPVASTPWGGVLAAPFAPDTWVTWATGGRPSDAAVWLTENAGATWTALSLSDDGDTNSVTIRHIAWSRHAANFLWIAADHNTGSVNNRAQLYYGDPTAGMNRIDVDSGIGSRYGGWHAAGVMNTGHFVGNYRTNNSVRKRVVVETTGSYVVNTTSPNLIPGSSLIVHVIGSTVALALANSPFPDGNKNIWRTDNFLANDFVDTGVELSTIRAASTIEGRVFVGGTGTEGVREILNPITSLNVNTVYAPGEDVQGISTDAQTKTIAVAAAFAPPNQTPAFFIFDGTEWSTFDVGEDTFNGNWVNTNAFDVIVRSV